MVFNSLYEILKNPQKPNLIIGITGFVGSGKTFFSKEFTEFLKKKNLDAIPFNMDIYNSTNRDERNRIISSLDKKYDSCWPKKAYAQNHELIRDHLTKIKQEQNFLADNLCNPQTKKLDFQVRFLFNESQINVKFGGNEKDYNRDHYWVLFDGVKIMEHREFFDCIIFLDANYQSRFNRLLARNKKLPSPANIKENLFKDVEMGLRRDHHLNKEYANIIIENNNFLNRKIIKKGY